MRLLLTFLSWNLTAPTYYRKLITMVCLQEEAFAAVPADPSGCAPARHVWWTGCVLRHGVGRAVRFCFHLADIVELHPDDGTAGAEAGIPGGDTQCQLHESTSAAPFHHAVYQRSRCPCVMWPPTERCVSHCACVSCYTALQHIPCLLLACYLCCVTFWPMTDALIRHNSRQRATYFFTSNVWFPIIIAIYTSCYGSSQLSFRV